MFTRLANWFKSSFVWTYGKKAVSSTTAWVTAWFHPEKPCPLDSVLAAEREEILNARELRRQELKEAPEGVHVGKDELDGIIERLKANALRKSTSAANTREGSTGVGGHRGGFEL